MFDLTTEFLATMLLAGFLTAAVIVDVRTRRIPNLLCLATLIAGFGIQALDAGLDGIQSGAAGLLTGLAVLLPLYLSGGMGAGDVKLMAAVGVFLGAPAALIAGLVALLTGSAIAGGVAAWQRIQFWAAAHGLVRTTDAATGITTSALQFPYAAAIALGVAVALSPLVQIVRSVAA
jgi:prepilin peptidase CpaA